MDVNGVHVDQRGRPPSSTFKWDVVTCRILVLLVWGITPVSWAYSAWFTWTLLAKEATRANSSWATPSSTILLQALYLYALAEVVFSLYYRYLVHKAQVRSPLLKYSRPFLRQTLARALEDGMKLEDAQSTRHQMEGADGETFDPSELPKRPSYRARASTFSKAKFSKLSFLDKSNPLAEDDPRAVDWRRMFSNWFLGTRWEDLKRENVLEWLAWSFYCMPYEDIVSEWNDEGRPTLPKTLQDVEEIMNDNDDEQDTSGKLAFLYNGLYMLEARAGMRLPDGRTQPAGRSIRLHLDPVRATSRPLAKYLVTGFFNVLLQRRMSRAGFVKHSDGGLEYHIRVPDGWKAGDEATSPLLFLHGLGMGLAQYASLVSYFEQHSSLRRRPLILLVQPHVSMSLFHPEHRKPPTKESTTRGLKALIRRWGFKDGVDVVSHSNGTIVHGWLLKEIPELVKRSCLVDPVTFCLWEPQVAYNFLYSTPKTGIEILMRYFVGEELGIALMLQRYFDWSANILWFEEIPNALDNFSTAYYLSEKDSILDAKRTARYLRDHGVRLQEEGGNLRFCSGMAHGEALITGGDMLKDLMTWVNQTRSTPTIKSKQY